MAPRSPLRAVADISARLLVTHGRDDEVVPVEQTRLLVEAARAHGVEVHYFAVHF